MRKTFSIYFFAHIKKNILSNLLNPGYHCSNKLELLHCFHFFYPPPPPPPLDFF